MTTYIDDIVESLVATSYALPGDYSVDPPRNVCTEAAELIATLREALAPIAAKAAEIEEIARDVDADDVNDIGVGVSYAECCRARELIAKVKP